MGKRQYFDRTLEWAQQHWIISGAAAWGLLTKVTKELGIDAVLGTVNTWLGKKSESLIAQLPETLVESAGQYIFPAIIALLVVVFVFLLGRRSLVRNQSVELEPTTKARPTTSEFDVDPKAGPIEWRFDSPVTVFMYQRPLGEGVRIDAIQIHGTNKTDKPLKNMRARIWPDMTDDELVMEVRTKGMKSGQQTTALIPPRADFSVIYGIPSKRDDRKVGVPAQEFIDEFGGLSFRLDYDFGPSSGFEHYFSLSYLEDQIAHIEEKTKK